MLTIKPNSPYPLLIWLLVGVIFVLDIILPLNTEVVHAYLLALFISIFLRRKAMFCCSLW